MIDSVHAMRLRSGGPLAALERKLRVRRGDRRDPLRRSALYLGVGWVAFLVICAVGRALDGRWDPLLRDIAVHTRWLASVPLLILAEHLTGAHMAGSTEYLVRGGVVTEPQHGRYTEILQRAGRLGASTAVEAVLLVVSVSVGSAPRARSARRASQWFPLTGQAHGGPPSRAGDPAGRGLG